MLSATISKQNINYKMINKEAFTRIRNCATNLWVRVEMVGERLMTGLSNESLDDDIFRLVKAHNSEIWETNFILSCFPVLKEYLNFLDDPVKRDKSYTWKHTQKFKEIQECLIQLELFCTNRLLNTSLDQKYGDINPSRQKVLREQYFLETLSDILRLSFTKAECEKYLEPRNKAGTSNNIKSTVTARFQSIAKKLFISPKKAQNQLIVEEKIKICQLIYQLIQSICKNNPENELYAYNLLHQFQYQIKYLQEAVDCFISIISTNHTLLTRLNENVDITDLRKELRAALELEKLSTKKTVQVFNLKVIFDNKKNEKADNKPQNFIYYFLSLLFTSQSIESKTAYVKFLRSLCACNNDGVTKNQELLFQIFANYEDVDASVFMQTQLEGSKLEIEAGKGKWITLKDFPSNPNEHHVFKREMVYFQEQLKFYSDLLLDRNYLWKMKLEKKFPIKFVFEQIYNSALTLDLRSIFCSLAFTLYVDHEPLNSKVVPNLCRVFKSNHLRNQPSLLTSAEKIQSLDQENFTILIENLMKIVQEKKSRITDKLREQCAGVHDDQIIILKGEPLLDNVLFANIIKLLSKMARFDVFTILNKNHLYSRLVYDLINILEYEKSNPGISYVLANTREVTSEAPLTNRRNMINLMGDFMGDFSKNVVGTMKNFADNVFGNAQKKKNQSGSNSFVESEDSLYLGNPIMKGLLDIQQQLEKLVLDQERKENKNEIIIKEEICNLLNFMIDLRQDFLVSNVLGWYDHLLYKTSDKASEITERMIETGVFGVLPTISKTGIKALDDKFISNYKVDIVDSGSSNAMTGGTQVKEQFLFRKYTEENEIPDLDSLFAQGKEGNNKSKGILPSLLMTFYMCTNTDLQNKILTVIMRMFSQKQELVRNLDSLEVIFQKKDIGAYYKLEAWFTHLRLQTETSEIWLQNFVNSNGRNSDGVTKVYELLSRINKIFNNESAQTTKHFQSRQYMVQNLAGFTPIVELIRDGVFHLKKAANNPSFPEEALEKLKDMFRLAHVNLICFVKNNETNQRYLAHQLPLFLSNLGLDIHQVPLICEIIKNHRFVCEIYADQIINGISEAIITHGRKEAFLDPLLLLQRQKKIFSLENQMKILDSFLSPKNLDEERTGKLLYGATVEGTKDFQFQFDRDLPFDQPFIYHAKLFDVLALYDENNEYLAFTHVRLRKILNVPYCLFLALQPDTLTSAYTPQKFTTTPKFGAILSPKKGDIGSQSPPGSSPFDDYTLLKPRIIQILHLLFLKADSETAMEMTQHMELFNEFMNSELKRLYSLPKDYKPSPKFLFYLVDCLVPFLSTYTSRILIESNEEQRELRGSKIISNFAQTLYDHTTTLLAEIPTDKMKIVQEFLNSYCEDVNNYKTLAGIEKGTVNTTEENAQDTKTLKTIGNTAKVEPNIAREDTIMSPETTTFSPIRMETKKSELQDVINFGKFEDTWHYFVSQLLTSSSLGEEIKNEKLALSEAIWNFKDIISDDLKRKYNVDCEPKGLLKKLILYLQYGIYNKADKQTMISTLKILRTLVDTAPNRTQMQDFFDKIDATKMLLSIFSDSKNAIKDDDLMSEFLSFWISLLEGGNQNVQRTIYNFCMVYQKSEVMFAKFYSIIYEQIEYLQVKTAMKTESENGAQLERHSIKSLILEKLLRLLQLFTEGHYLDLQNYLRYQTHSRNRYNIVEAVIELLKIYYQDLIQENYENIIRCLDTLNEFVQGPCPENQLAMIDGKFFDVAVGLLSKKIPKEKKAKTETSRIYKANTYVPTGFNFNERMSNNNRQLERWMLSRLKYKVMILLNSLLEMRSSDSVVSRIMRSLPLQVLKINLVKVYRKYKKTYGTTYSMDAFKHFEDDPRERDNTKPISHFELIVETGFLTYFLISSYLEADVKDADLQNEIQEMQEGFVEQTKPKKHWLTDNIVGQVGEFCLEFLKTSYNSLCKKRLAKKNQNMATSIPKEEEKKIIKAVEYRSLVKEAFDFFSRNSAHIEVVRNKKLEKVHFMLLPFCKEIPQEKKNYFHDHVNRQSPQTKVSDLVKFADQIIEICKHELRLKLFFGRHKVIAVFANFVNLWKDLSFFTSIALNILILGSYSQTNAPELGIEESRMEKPIIFLADDESPESTEQIFFSLGSVMVVSSIFVLIFFLIKRAPLVIQRAWGVNTTGRKRSFMEKFTNTVKTIYLSLKTFEIVYYISYAIFAVLGISIHPFFYAFHLTQILTRYPTLKNLIRAIYEPRRQLGLTFLLYMILTYIFSLIGFEFFSSDYGGACHTTWECFLTTFDFTFKVNGGIGGLLDEVTPPEVGTFRAGRFFFDFLFNMLLVIIMTSIVSGIIIDTFGHLREEEEEKMKDINHKCFVCGLSKEVFEKQSDIGNDFTKHIKKDHYMWNYIFFIAYLKDKDETEYTGIESYIYEKLQKSDFTSWFPLFKSLSLKTYEEDDEERQRRILGAFEEEIEIVKKGVKEIATSYGRLTDQLVKA